MDRKQLLQDVQDDNIIILPKSLFVDLDKNPNAEYVVKIRGVNFIAYNKGNNTYFKVKEEDLPFKPENVKVCVKEDNSKTLVNLPNQYAKLLLPNAKISSATKLTVVEVTIKGVSYECYSTITHVETYGKRNKADIEVEHKPVVYSQGGYQYLIDYDEKLGYYCFAVLGGSVNLDFVDEEGNLDESKVKIIIR